MLSGADGGNSHSDRDRSADRAASVWLLLWLLRGLVGTRFAKLCHPRHAQNALRAPHAHPEQFPKPCVAGSSPAGGARSINRVSRSRDRADCTRISCSFFVELWSTKSREGPFRRGVHSELEPRWQAQRTVTNSWVRDCACSRDRIDRVTQQRARIALLKGFYQGR